MSDRERFEAWILDRHSVTPGMNDQRVIWDTCGPSIAYLNESGGHCTLHVIAEWNGWQAATAAETERCAKVAVAEAERFARRRRRAEIGSNAFSMWSSGEVAAENVAEAIREGSS